MDKIRRIDRISNDEVITGVKENRKSLEMKGKLVGVYLIRILTTLFKAHWREQKRKGKQRLKMVDDIRAGTVEGNNDAGDLPISRDQRYTAI